MTSDNTMHSGNARCHTPGPWRWAEREFDARYIKIGEDGKPALNAAGEFKAQYPGALKHRWVYLLVGPKKPGVSGGPDSADEYDYPQVFARRWGDLKADAFTGGLTPENAALIASAPELLTTLQELVRATSEFCNNDAHGISGDLGSRLSDANSVIAKATGSGD